VTIRLLDTPLASGRLGLGLAALGRPAYINLGHHDDLAGHTEVAALEQQTQLVLDAAYEAGVRYFDAARSYGKAEAFLGSWLKSRGLGLDQVTVGSKWGYRYTAGWRVHAEQHEVKDLSAEHLRRQWRETRELLGSHLNLYQIHSATLDSGVLDDSAVLGELMRLREQGVAIGLSVSGPAQGQAIERALKVGGFDAVQATWNLHERSAGEALAAAHGAGLTVIVKEAVANGRLTERGDAPELIEAARTAGVTADTLALAAVLAQPWADVVLSGASTPAMLRSNLAAARVEFDERGLDTLGEDPEDYWKKRSSLAWN
jgi:aryl-alcohol dehydrogenase-like predicted oxidoreductase